MRLILRTITLMAFFLMLSTGTLLAADVVENGRFDSGLAYWDSTLFEFETDEGSIFVVSVDNRTANNRAAKLQVAPFESEITLITLSQNLTLSSPTGTLSFDVKFDTGTPRDPDCTDTFFQATFGSDVLMAYNVTGPYDESFNDITLENLEEEGWYRFTQVITGSGTLYFELYDYGGFYNTTAWVDNVVLTENVNPVPEPSTMLLLAAGLLGLISTGFRFVRR